MKKLFLLLLIVTLLSCSKETEISKVEIVELPKNSIEIKINGERINDEIVQISSFFMCGNSLSVNVTSKKDRVTSELFRLNLLKNGELTYANFVDRYSIPTHAFSTPDFVPSSLFKITDFTFIENKLLKIKFEGKLLKQIYNYNAVSESKQISGTIEIKEFGKTICNTFDNYIKLNNEIYFNNIAREWQEISSIINLSYHANSLNGYNIQLKNFTKFIPDMALGTYSFNNLSTSEKIEFRKYIGVPKVFGSPIIPSDWKKYETNGSFTIVEKKLINGRLVIKLKLNFTATYNGIVEYNFVNAEFETIN